MHNQARSRRDFIKFSSIAGAGALAASGFAAKKPGSPNQPKNLIFLVVDGMGIGTLSLAQAYNQRIHGKSLEWFKLFEQGACTRSLQDTASANSPVTDSAAAGSSWGCGQRVNNGSLNVTPDGSRPKPLFLRAKEAGKATGLVSTCRITHATPASFVTNFESRDSEDAIAAQYLERGMDVYLGGGSRHFQRANAPLLSSFKANGYALAEDRKELQDNRHADKLLGLFSRSHMPYAIDRKFDESHKDVPGLVEMFETALGAVSRNPNGFVLQVEAGRVDHAGHSNDPAAIVHEQLEFDQCIPLAIEFQKNNPDTLVVITTDHGTAGCQLNGVDTLYMGTNEAIDSLAEITGSLESFRSQYKKDGAFDAAGFSKMTGIGVSEEQVERVAALMPQANDYFYSAISSVFDQQLLQKTGVGFSSTNHTSEHVELLAIGPGQEAFPGFLYNYQVNGILRKLLAI